MQEIKDNLKQIIEVQKLTTQLLTFIKDKAKYEKADVQ
jgi:hypothetical protein